MLQHERVTLITHPTVYRLEIESKTISFFFHLRLEYIPTRKLSRVWVPKPKVSKDLSDFGNLGS